MSAQSGGGSTAARNLKISPQDEEFTRTWYRDMCGDKDFEKNYLEFMGAPAPDDDPRPGSNRRLLGAFYENDKNDKNRESMNAKYLLDIYHHTASGDRADSENWYWRLAFLVGLLGLALVLGVDFLQWVHAEEWDSLSWLKMILFFVVLTSAGAFFTFGNKIVALLKNLK